ncbi:hypothetical protein LEP1GSC112_3551 [Leptospira interrogans serovar Pomona str. UT364]|nr:hypothetical protein LEP1GSC112_3551 [Leptospira interrogans serovar Pomona str. UT364]
MPLSFIVDTILLPGDLAIKPERKDQQWIITIAIHYKA